MSTKNTIRKIKLFWAWQDNEREEWLRNMSLAGQHLESISSPGMIFNFTKGEPIEYNYQLDFRLDKNIKMSDYVEFIQDTGWEHIDSYAGWQYFRKPTSSNQTDVIFTDTQSKVKKYKRLLAILSLFYPGFLVVFLVNLEKYPDWFAAILVSVFVLLATFISTSIIGVALRIKKLQG